MRRDPIWASLVYRNCMIAFTPFLVVGGMVLSLAGCSGSGEGGPAISSLSTPTDTPPKEDSNASSQAASTNPAAEEDATASLAPEITGSESEQPGPAADLPTPPEEEDPTVSVTSTPSGATARLTWDVTADPDVVGYTVYYGKKSSGEHGSCSYEESQSIEAPPATITGLDPNTPYFFAISAYGGESESPCSNEVLVVTPATQG